MGSYLTVREAAEKWGLSRRRVNEYCIRGRIPGAKKTGRAWAIPAEAERPGSAPQREKPPAPPADPRDLGALMPLMNSAFRPGECRRTAEAMEPGPRRDIAMAEYHYFSGRPEAAAMEAEPYLSAREMGTRLSAGLIFAYANLSLGRIQQAKSALGRLNAALAAAAEKSPELRAAPAFVAAAAAVLLHLPLPEQLPETESFLPLLPPGLRAFALYVAAHGLYLRGEYARSAGMVEAALAMGAGDYPIPAIYLGMVAVMDYMSLKQPDRARAHLLSAWELARPDDLIEAFGEHHGLLGGMLEAVIKPAWPDDFRRIIEITYRFSSGWRRVHNPITGHNVADDLTTTEFAMAMLAAREWTNREIAEHLNVSSNTVKSHLSEAMKKLSVKKRRDLKRHILQ